jgi:glutamate-5-semialdehyde dehydrogenase
MTTTPILAEGMPILYGGDKFAFVPAQIAASFRQGDKLLVDEESGDLIHLTAAAIAAAAAAVSRAREAFCRASDDQISRFFSDFAARLEHTDVWAAIAAANGEDLAEALASGRSTARLSTGGTMRVEMIAGLRQWRDAKPSRGRLIERVDHPGWSVEQLTASLGVVGFVFEGRPNVVADAAGVLRGGNTAVLRIGSDALRTARAIIAGAIEPALESAGLPPGAVTLLDAAGHDAAWALFSDRRLALAVARGSGPSVARLGAVARRSGIPASLHGTGGAWLVADRSARIERFETAVAASLDRKVCNTLNVCCIVRERAADLTPYFLAGLERAGQALGHGVRLHVVAGDETWLPRAWLDGRVTVRRADGDHSEPLADVIALDEIGREWEWEQTPEVTLKVADDLEDAIALFNTLSPRFSASLIAEDPGAQERFYAEIEAPCVGDGFTRWVDGQYALERPELGLANWQAGRLFARGAVLTGEDVFTLRLRMRQRDMKVRR